MFDGSSAAHAVIALTLFISSFLIIPAPARCGPATPGNTTLKKAEEPGGPACTLPPATSNLEAASEAAANPRYLELPPVDSMEHGQVSTATFAMG